MQQSQPERASEGLLDPAKSLSGYFRILTAILNQQPVNR